jgi:hypothetical protein
MDSTIDTIKAVIANLLPRRRHEALEHLEPVSEDSSAEFLNEQEQAVLKNIINAGKTQRRVDLLRPCLGGLSAGFRSGGALAG